MNEKDTFDRLTTRPDARYARCGKNVGQGPQNP
jgi:hypothetical protein